MLNLEGPYFWEFSDVATLPSFDEGLIMNFEAQCSRFVYWRENHTEF